MNTPLTKQGPKVRQRQNGFRLFPCCVPFRNRMQKVIVIGGFQPQLACGAVRQEFTEALLSFWFAQNPSIRGVASSSVCPSPIPWRSFSCPFNPLFTSNNPRHPPALSCVKGGLAMCRIKAVPIHIDAHITAFLSARAHGNLTSGLFKGKACRYGYGRPACLGIFRRRIYTTAKRTFWLFMNCLCRL